MKSKSSIPQPPGVNCLAAEYKAAKNQIEICLVSSSAASFRAKKDTSLRAIIFSTSTIWSLLIFTAASFSSSSSLSVMLSMMLPMD